MATRHPDAPAVVGTGFKDCSYRELQLEIDDAGAVLHSLGLSSRSRVAICMPPGPGAALAIVAVACWAAAVPIDVSLTLPEIESFLASVRADAILLPLGIDTPARRAAEILKLPIIEITMGRGDPRLGLTAPNGSPGEPATSPDRDSTMFILQTSGTVGRPKYIPWTHGNMFASMTPMMEWYGLGTKDRGLVVLPLHHSFGIRSLWVSLLTGGSAAFPADPVMVDPVEWLTALRPTWYWAGPALHRIMLEKLTSLQPTRVDHALRFIATGSAAIARDTVERLKDVLGIPVIETFGCSEAGSVSANLPVSGGSKAGTVGRVTSVAVAIADENGTHLPAGAVGEILLQGPTVIAGYLDEPELNRIAFADNWYHTGDLGSLDEEGFLTLHGRITDFINRGGEKISPLEIDDALAGHPDVLEAAAFGVPNPRLGEDVAAAVVKRTNSTLTAADLRKFLGTRLAWSKVPRKILFVDELPRGALGKVQRRLLRDLVLRGS